MNVVSGYAPKMNFQVNLSIESQMVVMGVALERVVEVEGSL